MITENYKLVGRDEVVSIEFDVKEVYACDIVVRNHRGDYIGHLEVDIMSTFLMARRLHSLGHMYLDQQRERYLRQGVGSQALRLYRQHFVNDGDRFGATTAGGGMSMPEDGVGLTACGQRFVDAMVARGVLDFGGSERN